MPSNIFLNEPTRRLYVFVASKGEINSDQYRKRLWLAFRNLTVLNKDWVEEVATTIYKFNGDILDFQNGHWVYWAIPNIYVILDDSFIQDDRDILDKKPAHDTQKILKLRIIDLYFRISKPHIQSRFSH